MDEDMKYETILFEKEQGIGTLCLNEHN